MTDVRILDDEEQNTDIRAEEALDVELKREKKTTEPEVEKIINRIPKEGNN